MAGAADRRAVVGRQSHREPPAAGRSSRLGRHRFGTRPVLLRQPLGRQGVLVAHRRRGARRRNARFAGCDHIGHRLSRSSGRAGGQNQGRPAGFETGAGRRQLVRGPHRRLAPAAGQDRRPGGRQRCARVSRRCARVSRPRTGQDREVSRVRETCGRRFRRGRETCAERVTSGRSTWSCRPISGAARGLRWSCRRPETGFPGCSLEWRRTSRACPFPACPSRGSLR